MTDKALETKPDLETSAAKSLFLGNIIEENIFPFPEFDAEEKETLTMLLDSIEKFLSSKEEDFRAFDKAGEQPEEFLQELREMGLFGLIIPEEYDGFGFSNSAYSRVLQETSRFDGSTSLTIGAHSSIGMKGLLLFGTDEQKKKYLPKLATGETIAAFCLTEPGAGSDAASIKTNAKENDDGSWTLNGEKIWITNGAFAGFFTVFARTNTEKGKLSAFIVEKDFPGVEVGPKEDKLGIRASATTTVSFRDVNIPAENLLGPEGKGFKVAMSILNNGRTGLGGGCIGAMKASLKRAALHARDRKQFGRPIAEFALVQEKLSDMAVDIYAAESVVGMVGGFIDAGVKDYSVEAAISKVFATEALWRTAYEAMQVAGGIGYMKELDYERVLRDARINTIFEGTNEILRLFIALSGIKDAGEYLKDVGKSAAQIYSDPIKGFGELSGYVAKRFSRLTSLGRERLEMIPAELREEARVVEDYTAQLGAVCDEVLRRYKKDIIGKQLISKRLAEAAIDLFVSLCVLSRVTTRIEKSSAAEAEEEIRMARLFIQAAKRRMNQNLRRININEDEDVKALANFLVKKEGYSWDTL